MEEQPGPENRTPGRPPKTGDLRRDTRPLGRKRRPWVRRLASPRRLGAVALASLALLLAAAVGWWYFVGGLSTGPNREEVVFTPPGSLESLATEYPELATILQDPNMDSAYKEFLLAYQTGGEEAALALAEDRGLLNANGDLRLTLELDTTDTAGLEAELEANWIEVTAVSGNLMDIAIPLERLEMMMSAGTIGDFISGITTLDHVVRIRLPKVGIGDASGLQLTPAPVATATPPATPPAAGFFQSPNNILVVILGVLACVVAPILFALGAYLLLSGLGYIRRGRGDSRPVRPSGLTPPRRPDLPASPPPAPPGPRSMPAPVSRVEPGPSQSPPSSRRREVVTPPPPEPSTSPLLPEVKREPAAVQPPSAGDWVEMQSCPNCGRANRPGAKFCLACGTALESRPGPAPTPQPPAAATPTGEAALPPASSGPELPEHPRFCWNCGQALRPTSRFCPFCGDPV